jgi:hypothetical protein
MKNKELYVYRIKSNKWWYVLKIYIYQFFGYKVFVWGENNLPIRNCTPIDFPSAVNSVEYEPAARKLANDYFLAFKDRWVGDIYRLDYVRKTLDMSVLDYYAFETSICELATQDAQIERISPRLLYAIHNNTSIPVNFFVITSYLKLLVKLMLKFIKNLYLSIVFKNKIPIPEIIYFRKKPYPDLGECSYLCNNINTKNYNYIQGVYPISSKHKEKFGFYFLNSFEGMNKIFSQAFVDTLIQSFFDFVFYFKNGVDVYIFERCVIDTYTANIFSRMSPSVICGILVDKPVYILFYKNKNKNTKIVSLNESFFFPPYRSFDFNHLDQYYSMNNIDEKMQNIYGGKIGSFKRVEFFRNISGISKGISSDLSNTLKKYDHCILLAPAQVNVEKAGFKYWAYSELESFFKISLGLAKQMPETLFIVKGKKGELRLLPKWFQDLDRNNSNIFVIHCEKPRELESNRFEDLIEIADLTISMALTSTTIWQSIAKNKPVIAINRTKQSSILANYKGYESSLSEVHNNIIYWRSLSKSEILDSIKIMKKDFNIGQSDGLSQVALDLKKFID